MRRKTGLAVLAITSVTLLSAVVAQDAPAPSSSSSRPPKNLKKVGDHWTPWSPPEAKAEDYLVQPGDTLWDLGKQWLNDPYLWPQIWEQNRYILDSHWIYPGDPLVRPGKPTVVPAEGPPPGEATNTEAGSGAAPPPEPVAEARPAEAAGVLNRSRLAPLADEYDLRCADYIDASHQYSNLWVAGREMEKFDVAQGDVIYLSRGRSQGIEAGMNFAVIRDVGGLKHPANRSELGRIVRRLGRATVLCAQENTATAVIVDSCESIQDSDELVPWNDAAVPPVFAMPPFDRCQAPSGGLQGFVVSVKDDLTAVGAGNIVHADFGVPSGVRPGDFLTIYRDQGDLPRLLIGQAMVLTVEQGTCTAKVTRAVREFAPGDRAEIVQ